MVRRTSHRVFFSCFGLAALALGCAHEDTPSGGEFADEASDAALGPDAEAQADGGSDRDRAGSDAGAARGPDATVRPGSDASAATDASDRPDPGPSAPAISETLRIEGREILDTCGEPWMARGMEQIAGTPFSHDGTLAGLAAELIASGSNAVRLLTQDLGASELDQLLSALAAGKVVVYLSPGDRGWFGRSEIRRVLMEHEKGLILDAFQEPDYDDVPRWIDDAKGAIDALRSAGYTAPLTVLTNQGGRDLSAALEHGQEIFDTDPLRNTIVGWQAYWGNGGWYQQVHGMSLSEGVEACAAQDFPMQLGIDLYADPNDPMDYPAVMAAAERHGVGWLWWNFWNEWDSLGNNASRDGTADQLTPAGQAVVHSDANSIERTAEKACFR